MHKLAVFFSSMLFCFSAVFGQELKAPSKTEIDRARRILRTIKDDLQQKYYDPTYHGLDLDAHFQAAEEKLTQAQSTGQLWGIIGQTVVALNDSHTVFVPPAMKTQPDYGWRMQMIGDRCYVTFVKPGSDAEAKGLKVGDEILAIDSKQPTRDNVWLIYYLYFRLRPRAGMHLLVSREKGEVRQIDIAARLFEVKDIREEEYKLDTGQIKYDDVQAGYYEMQDLFIWKMHEFIYSDGQVDTILDKAGKHQNLIIDLRGNPGGYEKTLLRVIGNLFDHDITLGQLKRRKEMRPLVAKSRGRKCYAGNLIVLIDSRSTSASEMLARVMQIEKRGRIIGDRSLGYVMRARYYPHVESYFDWGLEMTDADIIMTDGKSLEHVGVTPDEIRLPTAADLAAKKDPVLSYAASLLGQTLSPEQRLKYTWLN